jgi:hypothetical protein
MRYGRLGAILLSAVLVIGASGCQAEQRPPGGSVQRIGSPASGSVSGSVSGAAAPRTGAAVAPASGAVTAGDGVYRPVGNVDGYLMFGADFQDISAFTNVVNEGRPLPVDEIRDIYENGKNFRSGTGTLRSLRAFARGEGRATEFPEAVQFYGSPTFLDDPVIEAINGTGSAGRYTPAQRRQAIQKGVQRILYYHTIQELRAAIPKIQAGNVEPAAGAPHNVDEAWAIYMGLPDGANYPRSLSATARSREANYNREGALDRPFREALERAKTAAGAGNMADFSTAQRDAESRLNATFYLSGARYLNEALKAAQAGNTAGAGASQVEGLYYYMPIQPLVARADAAADQAVMAYYRADPASLTQASRDETLAALNRTLTAIGLTDRDRVSPSDYQ